MFEDRLYDNIMGEMMAGFGAEVRTDEGSLAYNACARQALKLEEVYGDMEDIYDNMLPDRIEKEYLVRYAAERGVSYRHASCPVARGVFHQEIGAGELFSCGEFEYEVTGNLGGFHYELTCLTAGVAANTNFGELKPLDYIDEYGGGEITELLRPGQEDEDVEAFRTRVMDTFQGKAFGGNRADYRNFVNAIGGVGGCKPCRRAAGSSYIYIYLLAADYGTPSQALVSRVQELVDPEQCHGEGDGMAPVCHNVLVRAAESMYVHIMTTITWEAGYDMGTSGRSMK